MIADLYSLTGIGGYFVGRETKQQLSKEGERFQKALESGDFTIDGRLRNFFRRLPAEPRCKLCNVPFEGFGGSVVKRVLNKYPSNYNPYVCNTCFDIVKEEQIGVETEMSFLFADVRGSTSLAASMGSAEFSQLINRFYQAATNVLIHNDALIDKLIGDEVAAFFIPGFVGQDYAKRTVFAAQELLQATGHSDPDGPWIPVGVGVHSGKAWIGAVGSSEQVTDITALGDAVNISARLASQAGPGEILVSEESLSRAGLQSSGYEGRSLELKGKSEPFSVWVVHAS
jgi:adenylate cyclase